MADTAQQHPLTNGFRADMRPRPWRPCAKATRSRARCPNECTTARSNGSTPTLHPHLERARSMFTSLRTLPTGFSKTSWTSSSAKRRKTFVVPTCS